MGSHLLRIIDKDWGLLLSDWLLSHRLLRWLEGHLLRRSGEVSVWLHRLYSIGLQINFDSLLFEMFIERSIFKSWFVKTLVNSFYQSSLLRASRFIEILYLHFTDLV